MRIFLATFVSVIFISCSSVRLNTSGEQYQLTSISMDNIAIINGQYKNVSADSASVSGWSIWENLFPKAMHYDGWQNATVELKINKDTLNARLLFKDTVLDQFKTVCKTDRGCISLKRKWTAAFPAGPVFWALGDWKVLLGLDEKENLILFRAASGSAMLFILPVFPASGQVGFLYERVK